MRGATVLVLMALAAAVPASARSERPIFETLEGDWEAAGMAFRQPATSFMRWERVLGGKFWRLNYRIDFANPETSDFEGVGYYKPAASGEGRYVGTWADSTGDLHALDVTDDGSTLTTLWGVPGEKYGRSVYALTADGGVLVTDEIQRDGQWRQFNSTKFRRPAG